VRAEADEPERAERQQAEHGGAEHPAAFAPARGCEHEEGQREARRDLDADAHDERARGGAKTRAGAGGERQRGGEHHRDQRVVVRAANCQHEQHRVQPDERDRPAPRLAQLGGGARDERHRREARSDGDGLQRPQPTGEAERRGGVAEQREQRAVRRVLIRPADEPEDFVAGRLRCHVRVRIEAVQRAQAREAEIAEDVLGDQRRPQQQDHVRGEHRRDERAQRQGAGERQREQVAGAHDQRERLKAARADAHAQALQRSGQPRRPPAAAPGHVLRGFAGGACGDQEDGYDNARKPEQAQRTRDRGGLAPCGRAARGAQATVGAAGARDGRTRQGRGGRHRLIVTSSARAGVWWPM
jgi:hypothetical protein